MTKNWTVTEVKNNKTKQLIHDEMAIVMIYEAKSCLPNLKEDYPNFAIEPSRAKYIVENSHLAKWWFDNHNPNAQSGLKMKDLPEAYSKMMLSFSENSVESGCARYKKIVGVVNVLSNAPSHPPVITAPTQARAIGAENVVRSLF